MSNIEFIQRLGLEQAKAEARMRQQKDEQANPTGMELFMAALESTGGRAKELYESAKTVITGEDRLQEDYLKKLPELFSSKDKILDDILVDHSGAYAKMAEGFYSSSTPQQQIDILKANVPNIQFHTNKHGDVLVKYKGNVSFLNRPGFTTQDLKQFAVHFSSDVPAAGFTMMGAGSVDKALRGSRAYAYTSVARDLKAMQAGSEQEISTERALISGAFGGLGESAVPVINWMKTGKQASQMGVPRRELDSAAQSVERAKTLTTQTGIEFFPAQQTLSPTLMASQKAVLDTNVGIAMARKQLGRLNAQVSEAVENFVYSLATPEQAMKAPFKAKEAAQAAIDIARLKRQEVSSPIYTQALESGIKAKVTDTVSLINSLKSDYKVGTKMHSALSKVQKLLQKKSTKKVPPTLSPEGLLVIKEPVTVTSPVTNPKHLHSVKLEIDAMLAQTGDNSVDNTTRGLLTQVQKSLVSEMDDSIPMYAKARATYAEQSESLSSLVESPLFSVANVKPENIEKVTNILFNTTTNRKALDHTKSIIQRVDPKAWDAMVTHELEKRLMNVRAQSVDAATSRNEAQLLLAALTGGKVGKENLLRASLNKTQAKNYDYLVEALQRAATAVPAKTNPKNVDLRVNLPTRIYGTVFGNPRNLARLSIDAKNIQFATDAKIAAMAEVLLNPKYEPSMKQVRRLGAKSLASARLFQQLVRDAVMTESQLEPYSTYGQD